MPEREKSTRTETDEARQTWRRPEARIKQGAGRKESQNTGLTSQSRSRSREAGQRGAEGSKATPSTKRQSRGRERRERSRNYKVVVSRVSKKRIAWEPRLELEVVRVTNGRWKQREHAIATTSSLPYLT